jgi:hypothetical protein
MERKLFEDGSVAWRKVRIQRHEGLVVAEVAHVANEWVELVMPRRPIGPGSVWLRRYEHHRPAGAVPTEGGHNGVDAMIQLNSAGASKTWPIRPAGCVEEVADAVDILDVRTRAGLGVPIQIEEPQDRPCVGVRN